MSLAHKHFADLGQELLSAVTVGSRWRCTSATPSADLRVRQREVIAGTFGNPQGILDLAHRGIVGPRTP